MIASGAQPAPTGCIDDATSPQACLDEWVQNYDIGPIASCYINSFALTYIGSHVYVIFYGGCGSWSVDAQFDKPASWWNDVLVATGEKVNLKQQDSSSYLFNLKTGAQDRLGFRLPIGKEISYSTAYVV